MELIPLYLSLSAWSLILSVSLFLFFLFYSLPLPLTLSLKFAGFLDLFFFITFFHLVEWKYADKYIFFLKEYPKFISIISRKVNFYLKIKHEVLIFLSLLYSGLLSLPSKEKFHNHMFMQIMIFRPINLYYESTMRERERPAMRERERETREIYHQFIYEWFTSCQASVLEKKKAVEHCVLYIGKSMWVRLLLIPVCSLQTCALSKCRDSAGIVLSTPWQAGWGEILFGILQWTLSANSIWSILSSMFYNIRLTSLSYQTVVGFLSPSTLSVSMCSGTTS